MQIKKYTMVIPKFRLPAYYFDAFSFVITHFRMNSYEDQGLLNFESMSVTVSMSAMMLCQGSSGPWRTPRRIPQCTTLGPEACCGVHLNFYPSSTRHNVIMFPIFYYANSSIPVRQVRDWILYLADMVTFCKKHSL